MKSLIVGAIAVLALAGCGSQEEAPAPAQQTTDVTIGVYEPNGTPAVGITVVASQELGVGKNQIDEGVTDQNGQTTVTLPENATVEIGLWKNQTNFEAVYSWQTPFLVPVDNTSLSYSYYIDNGNCPVVMPGSDPVCPEPTPMASPTYYDDGAVTDWTGSNG